MDKYEEAADAARKSKNLCAAAVALGIPRSTFRNRLAEATRVGVYDPETQASEYEEPVEPKEVDPNLLEAVEAVKTYGTETLAAKALGIPRTTLHERIASAKANGVVQEGEMEALAGDKLRRKVSELTKELKAVKENNLTASEIRESVFKLAALSPELPKWVLDTKALGAKSPGVPSLFISDIHAGEVVNPAQINHKNDYNMTIMTYRLRLLVENTIKLLKHHVVNPTFPGLVIPVGGDLLSGSIHPELCSTNEQEIVLVWQYLFGCFIEMFDSLADAFGQLFIPWVCGNHSRTTLKVQAKNFNATNFDFLLGLALQKHYEKDKRVKFYIPDSTDALYRIFDYKYLLTHGNQFRGGDGMIGALGPIIRGDHKKRTRNSQIDMEYDTLLLGHFHQLMTLKRVIVNSSVKGYDEYAYNNNFAFEEPQQAMWLTHPDRGITLHMAVQLTDPDKKPETEWVGWIK